MKATDDQVMETVREILDLELFAIPKAILVALAFRMDRQGFVRGVTIGELAADAGLWSPGNFRHHARKLRECGLLDWVSGRGGPEGTNIYEIKIGRES